ncbi:hypothetical protein [Limnospira sp.]|uniref:hypothetical protein n=1 Tax=Limnospira sp. TaxID=3100384 RepID=UPI003F72BD2B
MIYDIDSQEATMNLVISEEITDNFNYSSSANADFVPDIQNYALTNNLEDIFVLDQLFPSLNNVVNSVNNTLIEDASGYAWFGHHSHITTNNADQDSRYYASEISGVSNLTDNPLNLSEMNLWEEAYSKAFDRLNSFVNNSNVEEQLKSVFGEQVDIEAAQNLINQIILGEIVPTIEIVSSADIGGAQGAYAKDTNTIYISQEVFSLNDVRFVTDVLTEEIGHYLDDYLGNEESLGDTGLAFAMQVRSQNLDVESLEFARSINDNITVDINGELTNLQTSSLQDRWYINIYEWENRTLDNLRYATQAVAGKTVSNVRSDGNIGFSENWGWGSPDVGNGNYRKPFIDLGDGFIGNIASDYFSKNMLTQYEFQAGEQYEFTVRSDDGFRIAASPIDSENWEFITRNDWEWETAYNTKTYTFTPQQSGDYSIYVQYREKERNAYFDLTWQPKLSDTTRSFEFADWIHSGTPPAFREFSGNSLNERANIDPSKETIIVIHGWAGSSTEGQPLNSGDGIYNLGLTIKDKNPDAQVLALDWHKQSAHRFTGPGGPAGRIRRVADWAIETLELSGVNSGENLTVIGHSLGSYLAGEIGDGIDNTKNLVALDPAFGMYDLNIFDPFTYELPTQFNQAAQNSLSLVDGSASSIGNLTASSTADVSFLIDYPWTERLNVWGINIISTPINPVTRHTGVVSVFQDIVERDLLGDDFTNWQIPPFVENHYNDDRTRIIGRHEGKIHVDENFKITRLETARGTYWEN